MAQFATKTTLPRYLRVEQDKIEKIAREYGLDFFPTVFEMLSYDQMNEIAAYGGFPNRYPHWRFGMEYERLSKSYEYGLSKIYEMVINNNPSFAYLLEGNSFTDQKLVMCHVFGHVDFFKNNFSFRATDLDAGGHVVDPMRRGSAEYAPNRKWIDKMANHGSAVRRLVDRHGIHKVEEFVDVCLSLENLIDPYSRFVVRRRDVEVEEEPSEVEVPRLRAKDYMDDFINPEEYIEEQRKRILDEREQQKTKFPNSPVRDVLLFLLENAPLERWERVVLGVIREEAYYFVPQMQTKVMNEGWACVTGDTLVITERGIMPMSDVVGGRARQVHDGQRLQRITATNVLSKRRTLRVTTSRGLCVTGSENHRVLLSDGQTFKRLDQLAVGDRLSVAAGANAWPKREVAIDWSVAVPLTQEDVAATAGVSVWTVLRHKAGKPVRRAGAVAEALEPYFEHDQVERISAGRRRAMSLPTAMSAELAAFVGYLIGDGHISRKKRHFGLTTGDLEQAREFARLGNELFGLPCSIRRDDGRYRVLFHSEAVSDFFEGALGMTGGPSARVKHTPRQILESPESVVAAYVRAFADCDGHAGKQGVFLCTASESLAREIMTLLLCFGILCRKKQAKDGVYRLHIAGLSAKRYLERIGFGLTRKQAALEQYIADHHWFKEECEWDQVTQIEAGEHVVYDLTVENSHRYAAAGFVNHNSFWHSKLMTERVADASEIIDYAENNAGVMATSGGRLNPYKLGVELFRHVEDRWNKGQFGREWEECDDLDAKKGWDLRLGLGREKIFEVRQLYTDVTFIDEFLTEDFARESKLFTYGWSNRNDRFEVESREFQAVKEKLLFSLTNFGNPIIEVEDANYENRGELLLSHQHRGVDLRADYARETLSAMVRVWKRPVVLATVIDGKPALMRYDGTEHSIKHDATP